ncbi:hypothetical protein M8J77_014185 [Diaphorina citri]|nr:hypothetical protein M8J77_014185 [Diaphorina citri]
MTEQQTCQASDELFGKCSYARAYPVCDARRPRPTNVKNGRGLPDQERFRLKKLVQTRIGTLNVGSMTGKGRELVDMMERRRVQILCVQETRWKGNKAKELGEGYKLFYSGANEAGRNGVGIILNNELKTTVVSVNRRNDRIMTMKLDSEDIINIMSVYAPQAGCEDEEKDTFWNELKQEIDSIPREERVIIGGDLNGHVGRKGNETRGRVHGGWSVGVENEEGRRIVDFALASDMALFNTFFEKQDKHLITYRSGGVTS